MHVMLTILTDVHSVCLLRGLNRQQRVLCTPCAVCAGSYGAASVKVLLPLIIIITRYWDRTIVGPHDPKV